MGPAFAVALGASPVVYADHDPLRLAIAERLGAERLALTSADDFRNVDSTFDVTVDASGEAAYLSALIMLTGRASVCTSVMGMLYRGAAVPFPVYEMYRCPVLRERKARIIRIDRNRLRSSRGRPWAQRDSNLCVLMILKPKCL